MEGCFIYKVVGVAFFLTKADEEREWEREKVKKEKKREREQQGGQRFPYLATQKATTKLVHFLINNTRLQKSFENRENLKL